MSYNVDFSGRKIFSLVFYFTFVHLMLLILGAQWTSWWVIIIISIIFLFKSDASFIIQHIPCKSVPWKLGTAYHICLQWDAIISSVPPLYFLVLGDYSTLPLSSLFKWLKSFHLWCHFPFTYAAVSHIYIYIYFVFQDY